MPGVTRAKGVRGLAREQKINAALVPAGVAATAAVALYAASWVGAKVRRRRMHFATFLVVLEWAHA